MKQVDLGLASPSLAQLLAMAQDESIMLIAGDGNSFILEHADDFDREVQQLGENEKFMTFLEERQRNEHRFDRAACQPTEFRRGIVWRWSPTINRANLSNRRLALVESCSRHGATANRGRLRSTPAAR